MKKSLFLIVSICTTIFMVSCNPFDQEDENSKQLKLNDQAIRDYLSANNIVAEKTPEGLYYVVTQSNSGGQEPKVGDVGTVHYVGSLLSGTVVDSTSPFFNEPINFIFDNKQDGEGIKSGIEYGLARLKEGEKATLFLPYNLAFGSSSSTNVPPFSVVKYDISSFNIQTEQEQIETFISKDTLTYLLKDSVHTAFLKEIPDDAPLVKTARVDSNVTVSYIGRFLDGREFDRNSSFSFTIKDKTDQRNSQVINGWNRALNGMQVGEKKIILLYSNLAYGAAGNSNGGTNIPPFSVLWFQIELLSVN